jgi:hypothetical protein
MKIDINNFDAECLEANGIVAVYPPLQSKVKLDVNNLVKQILDNAVTAISIDLIMFCEVTNYNLTIKEGIVYNSRILHFENKNRLIGLGFRLVN